MFPSLAYCGTHERDPIDAVGALERFLLVLAESGLDRDRELSRLDPTPGMVARPFGREASERLKMNDSNADLFMEG